MTISTDQFATNQITAPARTDLAPTSQPATHPPQAIRAADRIDKVLPAMSFPNRPQKDGEMLIATIPNVAHLLRGYGIHARYNVVKKKLEIRIPHQVGTTDNADNVAMTHIVSLAALNRMSLSQVPALVEVVGDWNAYNPAAEWIFSRSWDGVDRMPAVYATLVTTAEFPVELKHALIRRWLISAVAAAVKPSGFKARGVLTLQGPQGIGKTSWVKSLVSDPVLAETAVKVDHLLDCHNKDSILGAITHWIVEIGELDSSFKKDVSRLKGFLTNDQDKLRRPYARTEAEYPRRTIFCATVNERNFLVDTTGNSRWWTIPVTQVNFQHGIDMQQVFAQLAVDHAKNEQWWLTKEEGALLDQANARHLAISVVREQVLEVIDQAATVDATVRYVTTSEVLRRAGVKYPNNTQCKECAGLLRELYGEAKTVKGQAKWRVPLIDPTMMGLTSYETTDLSDADQELVY